MFQRKQLIEVMRYLLVMFSFMVLLMEMGCRDRRSDEVKRFIPSTYIRFAEHEFGSESDTLAISVLNNRSDEYQIVRRWKYERVIDGQHLEPEYKVVKTTAFYEAEHHLLQEPKTGKVYSFDARRKLLFEGTVQYWKL